MVIFDNEIHLLDIILYYPSGDPKYRNYFDNPETLLAISNEWLPIMNTVELLRPDVFDAARRSTLDGRLDDSIIDELVSSGFCLAGGLGDGSGKDMEGDVYFWASKILFLISELLKMADVDISEPKT